MEEQHQSVSNCYVFKSRLQEYAQKAGLTTPTYHTIKEGPSHQPVFRSSVVINEKTYDSLTGFLNRKASEQSAAEVALIEISKSGATDIIVSHPIHETGLCKNLLQEYAQKMNYAIPSYVCTSDATKGRDSLFSCTVDIGGIKYIGTAAKTKKEAELKAARTALLAIQMSAPEPNEKPETSDTDSIYTVVPTKRKEPERPVVEVQDKVKRNKRKKNNKFPKRRKKNFRKPGEVVEVKLDDSSHGEVTKLKTNGECVLVRCSNPSESGPCSNSVESGPCSFPSETGPCSKPGESVPCSKPGESFLRSNPSDV
ncbi:double-stranded RNA-binding protein 8-like isoform X2 [Rutidosis leptorrhynchoides]|uniref:double-stranded RNA-binding protein 8-like isoform X2 n=1 Tax=Rutidosis leptorrhynchoides TaxID=125765 RepID=UPI003A993990